MNSDEAQKCIDISKRKLEAGDIEGATKFAKKAAILHDSPEVQKLLARIATTPRSTQPNEGAAHSTSAEMAAADGVKHRPSVNREHTQPKREFTPDQEALVKRIRRCKHTAFYEILGIKKESTDAEVKKAYRKLALQLHPDKNGAPNADEAFKMVSRSFQILSDEGKREQFDRYGADPDSRQAAPSGFGQQAYGRGGGMQAGGMFGDEMNADDLFNMFFGGGMGAQGGFGGSPFVSFGGPGVRVHHFGGGGNRQQRRAGGDAGPGQGNWMQLLPLIILFGFSVLSSLFSSGESIFGASTPSYSFQQNSPYTAPRYTPTHKIPFWVNPTQLNGLSTSKLAQLDKKAEVSYIRQLRDNCEFEYQNRERRMNDAYGFFSVDKKAYEAARTARMENCEALQSFGYRI